MYNTRKYNILKSVIIITRLIYYFIYSVLMFKNKYLMNHEINIQSKLFILFDFTIYFLRTMQMRMHLEND